MLYRTTVGQTNQENAVRGRPPRPKLGRRDAERMLTGSLHASISGTLYLIGLGPRLAAPFAWSQNPTDLDFK